MMSDDRAAEILALRCVLAYSNDGGNQDTLAETLNQFIWGCPACTANVILVLLSMIEARLQCSGHHHGELVALMESRLLELLDADDEMSTEP